jgi:hypothetical protein
MMYRIAFVFVHVSLKCLSKRRRLLNNATLGFYEVCIISYDKQTAIKYEDKDTANLWNEPE